ncbi:hypothetical protein [Micromonospora sp. CPCC 205556]
MKALGELVDGHFQRVVTATAGATFVMGRPFELSIDPADLLDDG